MFIRLCVCMCVCVLCDSPGMSRLGINIKQCISPPYAEIRKKSVNWQTFDPELLSHPIKQKHAAEQRQHRFTESLGSNKTIGYQLDNGPIRQHITFLGKPSFSSYVSQSTGSVNPGSWSRKSDSGISSPRRSCRMWKTATFYWPSQAGPQ